MRSPVILHVFLLYSCWAQIEESIFHPAAVAGPQSEVLPASYNPPRVRTFQNRRQRSRVFREAGPSFEPPRLFRASGRFQKRVQSATTHDIGNVLLPQDTIQIVSYNYDAENHHDKKVAEDKMNSADALDYAKGMQRTTVAVKLREDEVETTTPLSNDITSEEKPQPIQLLQSDIPSQPRPKTFSQTVTATGSGVYAPELVPHTPTTANQQRAIVFTAQPPLAPPQVNLGLPPQITQLPHQPIFPPVGVPPGIPPNPLAPPLAPPLGAQGAVYPGLSQPQPGGAITSPGLPRTDTLNGQPVNATLEQLGCGFDWLTNSCKDVFNLGWCGKCHDFGNVFLHDCKCVAPLIQIPKPPRQPTLFWFF